MKKSLRKVIFEKDTGISIQVIDEKNKEDIYTIDLRHNNYFGVDQRLGISRAVESAENLSEEYFKGQDLDANIEAFKATILPSLFVAHKHYILISEKTYALSSDAVDLAINAKDIICHADISAINNKYNESASWLSINTLKNLINKKDKSLNNDRNNSSVLAITAEDDFFRNVLGQNLTSIKDSPKQLTSNGIDRTKALLIGCCIRSHYPEAIVKDFFANSTYAHHDELLVLKTYNTLAMRNSKNFICPIRSINQTSRGGELLSQADILTSLATNIREFSAELDRLVEALNIKYIYVCDVKTPETIIASSIAKRRNCGLCILSHSGVPQLIEWVDGTAIDSIDCHATTISYPEKSIYLGATEINTKDQKDLYDKYKQLKYRVNPWLLGIKYNEIKNTDLLDRRRSIRKQRGFKPRAIITAEYIPYSVTTMSQEKSIQLISDLRDIIIHLASNSIDCCLRFRGESHTFLPKLLKRLNPNKSISDCKQIINNNNAKLLKISTNNDCHIEIGWGTKNATHQQLQSVDNDPYLIMMENSTTAAVDALYAKIPCLYFYRDEANSFNLTHKKVFSRLICHIRSMKELKQAILDLSSDYDTYYSHIKDSKSYEINS